MALTKTTTVSKWTEDNKTAKITTKTVESVVVDNQLVPDIRAVNPGVISGLKFFASEVK